MGFFTRIFKAKEKVVAQEITIPQVIVDDEVAEAIIEAIVEAGSFEPNLDVNIVISSCKTMADCKNASNKLDAGTYCNIFDLRNKLSDITFEIFVKKYNKSKEDKLQSQLKD